MTTTKDQVESPTWSHILPCLLPSVFVSFIVYSDYKWENPFIAIWMGYVLIPLLDYILPLDNYNLSQASQNLFEKDKRFLIPLYLCWSVSVSSLYYALYNVSNGYLDNKSYLQCICYLVAFAHAASFNAVVGHELLHKRETVHKIFGTLAFSVMLYS